MRELIEIITKIYEDEDLRNTCIPLFLSNPGMGKTSVIKQFAKDKGVNCLDIIASQLMPHEISGMAMPEHDSKKMVYFDYQMFYDLKDGDIVFFDELLNANPMVLNACLTILENRTLISGRKLPKVMIIAAANPQGAQIVTPQIKERFIWYNLAFDKESWKKYMSKYLISNEIYDQLCTLVQSESFSNSGRNYYTPRSIEKAIKMMLADVKTPYEIKLKPILETKILNITENDISLGDFLWTKNSPISWLQLQKLMKNETTTEQ
jgi:hypothetical protein